jgi:hypothetical protein
VQFAKRRLAEAIGGLPERRKLYATLSFFEELDDTAIGETLGISHEEATALARETHARLAPAFPLTSKEASALRTAAEEALRCRLREITGTSLDRAGRTADVADAFVASIRPDERTAIEGDLREGGGGELREEKDATLAPRFHSARSSCALAVNAFGPWRLHPQTLTIAGIDGFVSLRFEGKCPIRGVPTNREPPNLDAIAEGASVVAIESKLIEYLTSKKAAHFDDVYREPVSELADSSWTTAYERLKEAPDEFQCFDAAQIVKHYLGLKSVFAEREVTLLYLYWEPPDHEAHRLFAQHREEVASFAQDLADPAVTFASLTYAELWDAWSKQDQPDWLQDHVGLLTRRYLAPSEPGVAAGDPVHR